MITITQGDKVGQIVRRYPATSRVFEAYKVDYCCGGNVPLSEVCRTMDVSADTMIRELQRTAEDVQWEGADVSQMTLTDLVDHIEQQHHTYVKSELPRLVFMADKVANAHGERNERLYVLRGMVNDLASELTEHLEKEEKVLFPMIRRMEIGNGIQEELSAAAAMPMIVMEEEHDAAGSAMEGIRNLMDEYVPPTWACNTYRAMLDGLHRFEQDLHQHVHKENNILFSRLREQSTTLSE